MIIPDPITRKAVLDSQGGCCAAFGYKIANAATAMLYQADDKSLSVLSWLGALTHLPKAVAEVKKLVFANDFQVVEVSAEAFPNGEFLYDTFRAIGARSRGLKTKPDQERTEGHRQVASDQVGAEATASWAREHLGEWPTLLAWACWCAVADTNKDLNQRVWAWAMVDRLAHEVFEKPPQGSGARLKYVIPAGLLQHKLRSTISLGQVSFPLHQLSALSGTVPLTDAYSGQAVTLVQELLAADPTEILFNKKIAGNICATPIDSSYWPFERSPAVSWSIRQAIDDYREDYSQDQSPRRFFDATFKNVTTLLLNHLVEEQHAVAMARAIASAALMAGTGSSLVELRLGHISVNRQHVAQWEDWATSGPPASA